jgi:ribosome-binding factor A
MLSKELSDPRLGFITITEVKFSPDLRQADIYFSVLGSKGDWWESLEGLESAKPRLKGEIARRLRLKFTPEINFHPDETHEKAERINTLLKEGGKIGTSGS